MLERVRKMCQVIHADTNHDGKRQGLDRAQCETHDIEKAHCYHHDAGDRVEGDVAEEKVSQKDKQRNKTEHWREEESSRDTTEKGVDGWRNAELRTTPNLC